MRLRLGSIGSRGSGITGMASRFRGLNGHAMTPYGDPFTSRGRGFAVGGLLVGGGVHIQQ